MVERSEVQYGNTTIPYTVIRARRRKKTVAVAVDPLNGVQVRAPVGIPLEKLDEIVLKKARWITERRQRLSDLPPAPDKREFVSGETYLYLGRQYRLKVVRMQTPASEGAKLIGGRLVVPVGPGVDQAREVRRQLVSWYRDRAAIKIPERVAVWSQIVGVEPAAVVIRDQKKRWGSCNKRGELRFNWRVVETPMRVVDYVVVHELVHLRRQGHTRDFWAEVGRVMGDYEERREALRRVGRTVVW